jgi:hypothetical protein
MSRLAILVASERWRRGFCNIIVQNKLTVTIPNTPARLLLSVVRDYMFAAAMLVDAVKFYPDRFRPYLNLS